jgi:acyl-CoA thioesterase YciA
MNDKTIVVQPGSDPVLRVVPQRSDINSNGHIFGGWILAQMDIAGGITAGRRANGAVATVAVDGMQFHHPILLGDVLSIYCTIRRIGRTSMAIHIDVLADRRGAQWVRVTEAVFTFVALDSDARPRPIDHQLVDGA